MQQIKPIILFFCRFIVLFGIFAAPWPGIHAAYGSLYAKAATLIFAPYCRQTTIQFSIPQSIRTRIIGIEMFSMDTASSGGEKHLKLKTTLDVRQEYIDTVFFIALVLAASVSRSRKAWALLWGLLFIHAFIVFRLVIMVAVLDTLRWMWVVFSTWVGLLYSVFLWTVTVYKPHEWWRFLENGGKPKAPMVKLQ